MADKEKVENIARMYRSDETWDDETITKDDIRSC